MFAGHFGVAAAVKAKQPEVPMWAFLIATQLLDLAFLGFAAVGLESIENNGGYGDAVIQAGYTHSLAGALLLTVLAGWAAAKAWGNQGGTAIGAVVFSHWLLDLLVHRPDLPLLPGNAGSLPLMGLGLWEIPAASAVVEGALIAVGLAMYVLSLRLRSAKAKSRVKFWASGIFSSLFMGFALVSDLVGL